MKKEAVECYNVSLWLYPENPRALFNRAIAFERIYDTKQAQADYRHAFSIDPSLARLFATVEDIEPFIELDEKGVSEFDQQVYLLRRGFVTGSEEKWAEIARRCGGNSVEMKVRFNSVLNSLYNKVVIK
jgi:tetratricopeptide (TPR) repeat protein